MAKHRGVGCVMTTVVVSVVRRRRSINNGISQMSIEATPSTPLCGPCQLRALVVGSYMHARGKQGCVRGRETPPRSNSFSARTARRGLSAAPSLQLPTTNDAPHKSLCLGRTQPLQDQSGLHFHDPIVPRQQPDLGFRRPKGRGGCGLSRRAAAAAVMQNPSMDGGHDGSDHRITDPQFSIRACNT